MAHKHPHRRAAEVLPPPKRPKMEEAAMVEVPKELRDMEVPLGDLGDAIILTGF